MQFPFKERPLEKQLIGTRIQPVCVLDLGRNTADQAFYLQNSRWGIRKSTCHHLSTCPIFISVVLSEILVNLPGIQIFNPHQ